MHVYKCILKRVAKKYMCKKGKVVTSKKGTEIGYVIKDNIDFILKF